MGAYKIKTLADIEEIEKVPFERKLVASNTYDLIRLGAAIRPEAPAVSLLFSGDAYDKPVQVSYADFWSKVNQTANLFHDLGVGPRDVITYLLPNLIHTHYVVWGGEAAGIVNPINPMLEVATIEHICRAANTKVLVALGEFPGADIWDKALALRKRLPSLRAVIRIMGPSDEKEGIYGYDEVIGRYSPKALDSKRVIDPQEVASIYHTGGTTGTPKLTPRTHLNEASMISILRLIMDLEPGEAMLCGLPMFHANATMATGAFPLSTGAHVILLSPRGYRDPSIIKNFFKIVEHYRAVTFSAVPTVLSMLLEVADRNADISSLRFAICGAAPLSVELFKRFEAHCGMKILEGYGLTEGTLVSSVNPLHGERKVGSIGLRIPYLQMRAVVETKEGKVRDAQVDEIGPICIRGPSVFPGYLEEAHNRGAWVEGGWFNTGDLGRQDADGYFWLTGRKKDLIIRGGHNIDPALIEDPLYRLDGVQFAAVVGRPDVHAGEVPVAYVQIQQGSKLTAEDILQYLQQEVGERAAIPKEVVVFEAMPLTPIGKIFKPALRWDAIRRVYERELRALGDMVEKVQVEVGEDKVHGSLATLLIEPACGVERKAIEQKISEILGNFTIRYVASFR
ncbi:MAG: acyl-CoA synthetase [Thermodesulfobacteriota bacterium]